MLTPAFDQEAPERIPAAKPAPQPLQRPRHLHRPHEMPDIDVAGLAQHLAK
jgi:hypothetical protein